MRSIPTLASTAALAEYLPAKEFNAFVHSEDECYGRFIKENGITAE